MKAGRVLWQVTRVSLLSAAAYAVQPTITLPQVSAACDSCKNDTQCGGAATYKSCVVSNGLCFNSQAKCSSG